MDNTITLKNIQKSDAGTWIVIANNSVGPSRGKVKVTKRSRCQ